MGEATPPRARFAPFMAEYLYENASNLHAGLSAVKSCSKKGGSGARGGVASPMTMAFPQLVLKKWGNSCRKERLTEWAGFSMVEVLWLGECEKKGQRSPL